jgi:hypothetical protein
MNRLLNILVLVDQNYHLDCEIEKVFRSLGRVITLGKDGQGYTVDFKVPETVISLSHCVKQLPEPLKPDLVVVSGNAHLFFNDWPDEFPKFFLAELIPPVVDLSGFKLVGLVSKDANASREITGVNIPYANEQLSARVISDCLKAIFSQNKTKSFAEYQLLEKVEKDVPPEGVAFIIAVLDESPSSAYNIGTLLKDLDGIEGDVICVFNSLEMGEKYAKHPRITKSAVLSENIGVGRAWNVGLMMTTQPTVFILNSDLHLENSGVQTLRVALYSNPNIAIAGPCGGFNDFQNLKDLHYIDKQLHAAATLVDQVSGFYFVIKRELFSEYQLQFYPEYIPCYMEEWDLAMQLKKHNLLALRVPIHDYAHTWGGTVNGLSEIPCLGGVYKKTEILKVNQTLFLKRWQPEFEKLKLNVYLPN